MSVPSIPYYENVNSKIRDAQFQKDSDMRPRIYSQKCFSGSSAEVSPCKDSEIFWDSKAPHKPEMNAGADHVLNSSKRHSFSCPICQNQRLTPTNDNARIPDPQMWNPFRDSAFGSPKSKFFISPRRASVRIYPSRPQDAFFAGGHQLGAARLPPRPVPSSCVPATAFKKACRRLGVTRWDYRRGPGRASSKNVACPTGPVAT